MKLDDDEVNFGKEHLLPKVNSPERKGFIKFLSHSSQYVK